MSAFNTKQKQQSMNNNNGEQSKTDGFTVVKSKNSFKEYNRQSSRTPSPPNNNNQSYHNNNKESKQPPTKPIKKLSYEEQFPSIAVVNNNIQPVSTNNILNFKTAIDTLSNNNIISKKNKIHPIIIEEKEKFDLSLYVKIQERRQKEYDLIYGKGAFVSDRLNYERFDSEHESDNDDNSGSITDGLPQIEGGDY